MKKNIYIIGFYLIRKTGEIDYWLTILGQYGENSDCVYIKDISLSDSNYNIAESLCRQIYCDYFNTDMNNLIGIFNVNNLVLILEQKKQFYKSLNALLK